MNKFKTKRVVIKREETSREAFRGISGMQKRI